MDRLYTVAGLKVLSDTALPELIEIEKFDSHSGVKIFEAEVPDTLKDTNYSAAWFNSGWYEVAGKEFLLKIHDVGKCLIRNGSEILYQKNSEVAEKNFRLYLLGSTLGVLFFQRSYFPLHASVAVIDGQAVAFTGDSGAGKSTIAAWLHTRGYPLLCDDVCVIKFDPQGNPMAYPTFPRLKLWDDTLKALKIDDHNLQQDYSRTNKFHLPIDEGFTTSPMPLKNINILQFSKKQQLPSIERIKPVHAVHLLRNNTYRCEFVSAMHLTQEHYKFCTRLAQTTNIYYITRNRNHEEMEKHLELIEGSFL